MMKLYPLRDGHHLSGRDGHPLGITAACQQSTHRLSDGPRGDAFAELGDAPGHLQAQNRTGARRRWIVARGLQQVGSIDARANYVYHDLPLLSCDVGHFLPDELRRSFDDDGTHVDNATTSAKASYHGAMEGIIAGRTASAMPGLDIAEQRSWQNFLDSALRLYATLNKSLVEQHHLTLNDVRLLDVLDKSATGSARMGDLADDLMSLPSRVTRQIHRLETQNLVSRSSTPDDGRGVLALITDDGRTRLHEAMATYGRGVRTHFLGRLSRAQVAAVGENCRRIGVALKSDPAPARLGRV
jgi:DNA-binding MarR family transcriptional regulator